MSQEQASWIRAARLAMPALRPARRPRLAQEAPQLRILRVRHVKAQPGQVLPAYVEQRARRQPNAGIRRHPGQRVGAQPGPAAGGSRPQEQAGSRPRADLEAMGVEQRLDLLVRPRQPVAQARGAPRGVLRAARGGPGVPWSRVRSARSASCCARRPAAARRGPPCSRPAATARCSWSSRPGRSRATRHPVPPATGTSHPAARARRRPRRCGNHGARPAPAPRRRWPLPGSFPWIVQRGVDEQQPGPVQPRHPLQGHAVQPGRAARHRHRRAPAPGAGSGTDWHNRAAPPPWCRPDAAACARRCPGPAWRPASAGPAARRPRCHARPASPRCARARARSPGMAVVRHAPHRLAADAAARRAGRPG